MMRWIVGSSLKFRRLVVAVAAGVLFLGVAHLRDVPVDVLPEFGPTTVEVQAEALGLSAEEVEQFVTVPLEQDLLNGVAFLDEIHSASLPGLSSVVMTFEPGTSLLDARQVVAERLTQAVAAAGLPAVAKPPQMVQPVSSTSRVSMVKLSSESLSPIETSVLARWVIAPRLLGVEGVSNVAIWGHRDRQLQVLVDPQRLRDRGVSLQQVIRSTGNALEVSPLSFLEASSPGTGGWIDTLNQRLHIFHEQAITSADELKQITLEDPEGDAVSVGDQPLTLGDVTDVTEDHQPLIGDSICRDGACLLMVIEKLPGANTVEVTRGVDAALDAMLPGLPGMQVDTSVYRPASFIEASFVDLGWALLIGAILLLLVLGTFLWDWRTGLISVVAIALSLAAAGVVLYFSGVTVNMMVLAGLVMALVVLIDDAVVEVENIPRRLWRHRAEGGGAPVWEAITEASLQMRRPMFYAALIVGAALAPVFFLDGAPGAFLPPLALTYVLAVAASMLVALTVTPALSMMLLANAPSGRRDSPIVRRLHRGHDAVSPLVVRRPGPVLLAAVALLVVGLVALPFLDLSLRPSLKERDVLIHLDSAPGTSLPRMNEITAQVVGELDTLPGVGNISAHVGRAVLSDQVVNVNAAEVWVSVDPSVNYDATVAAIEETVDRQRDVSDDVLTYSEERVTDVLQDTEDDIVVRIYGENPEVLRTKAEEVRGLLGGIHGIDSPEVELAAEEPTVEIETDLGRAQEFGVKPGDVRRAAATLLSGLTVGHLFDEQKVFDVVVWGAPHIRQSESDVGQLLIETPAGGHVRLDQVADVRTELNPSVIQHESVASYVDVSADVVAGDVGAAAGTVERTLEQVEFPLEHHAELLGGFAEQQAARSRTLAIAVAAAIAILLLLQAAFSSWGLAVVAFVTLPIALVGGVLAAFATEGTITLGSVAGFVAVLGIAARGEIGLIRHYQHLEHHAGMVFGPDLVLRGTRERLMPILMTAFAAAVVLAPFLIGGNVVGFEIVRPMAIVILGGLITSTLVNLFLVPAACVYYGRRYRLASELDTLDDELRAGVPDVDTVQG